MSAVWLIVGLLAGSGLTALVMRERIRSLHAEQEQFSQSFKAISAQALDASVQRLSDFNREQLQAAQETARVQLQATEAQARAQLQTAQAQVRGELEQRQQAVEQLVRPLQQQLERLNLERERNSAALGTQIRMLAEAQEKLRSETGALVTALRKPNVRGQWGQMQLRKVVELAGMVRHCDFSEQASFSDEEGTLRPDLIVNLPGGKHVVVDAKAPLQGILDAYEAPDEQARSQHLQAHARLLRHHVKQLADKAYWSGMESAPDFVVLFLPGEHLYGAALEADPELIEDAMARRVLISTPTTLLALLHSVAYGWQQERVAESAQAVSELGRQLYGRLAKLSGLIATLGGRLNSTVSAYNVMVGSYEARVLPGARRFADHGAVGAGSELPDLEQITQLARDVRVCAEDEAVTPTVGPPLPPPAASEEPPAAVW
ncbi:MAG: DNA recombination protein RmuC [Solirubrobacteraceae bacterium]